jgi:Family of unknown function (DUF6228)
MSASSFSIKSNASDRELVFREPRRDYFIAELRGSGVAATRGVYAHTDARGLARFFSRLAAYERPWSEAESWEALEGEFRLEAACSLLGEVRFSVRIRDMLGGPEEWQVSARLVTELGQLPGIASRAESFFNFVASD